MRFSIAPIAAVLFVAACTDHYDAPIQSYRPAGAQQAWVITGALEKHLGLVKYVDDDKYRVAILVNGQVAAGGELDENAQGSFVGSYAGAPITAQCTSRDVGYDLAVRCAVLVGNELAATLSF